MICFARPKCGKTFVFQMQMYSVRASPSRILPRFRNPRLNSLSRARFERLKKAQLIKPTQTDVRIPNDPQGILLHTKTLLDIFGNPTLVIERKMEMMNVFFGFEQANKYVIMDSSGKHVGYIAETGGQSFTKMLARQIFRTHRSFKAHILDKEGNEVLLIERPFSWVNSKIRIIDTVNNADIVVGEVHQQWHAWRRKYNLFLRRGDVFSQFAYIDEPLFSWDFSLIDQNGQLIGSVNRNFMGLLREMFTDTGSYVLRMDSVFPQTDNLSTRSGQLVDTNEKKDIVSSSKGGLTLDERAVILATAISIDFDYFSKLSKGGTGIGSFLPLWFPVFGGGTSDDSTKESESDSAPPDENTHVSSDDADKHETQKNWWDNQPDDDVWGEGDHDPWNNASQDGEDNDSWGNLFEEED
ncbi:hypothetical protein PORY_001088 [Pneumocystis oryctolagi]|uniref:Uncharacterized protein n=1 Tax=Pneumocystis oryctolagi TaxID=42067 RepID=A0ACB7CG56_9ASCO|nr:hypothetical protein PORY_001088 [Pneumocystis oryctolagi]